MISFSEILGPPGGSESKVTLVCRSPNGHGKAAAEVAHNPVCRDHSFSLAKLMPLIQAQCIQLNACARKLKNMILEQDADVKAMVCVFFALETFCCNKLLKKVQRILSAILWPNLKPYLSHMRIYQDIQYINIYLCARVCILTPKDLLKILWLGVRSQGWLCVFPVFPGFPRPKPTASCQHRRCI